MPGHRLALVALTAGAVSLLAVAPAPAKDHPKPKPLASPCQTPAKGFQSCLRVLYQTADDGIAEDVRATATLLLRVHSCADKASKRRVVISRDGHRLAGERSPGRCRKGIVTWRARFPASETAAWGLVKGDTVHADWRGVRHTASVAIRG